MGRPAMDSACAPATARSYEINIAEGDRPLLVRVHQDSLSIRVGLVVVAITASCGLAWIVMSSLASHSGVALVGESERILSSAGASSSPSGQIISSSASIIDSKENHLRTVGKTVREMGWEGSAEDRPKHHPSSASSRAKPSPSTAPPSPSTVDSTALQQRTTSERRLSANDLDSRAKLTPIPETRPTTIEGWTLREVTNGIAILEGPNGIWRVRRGDTVPGVGRIDSILLWGERWIVATSRGLISAP
jgi:hypothetical protein